MEVNGGMTGLQSHLDAFAGFLQNLDREGSSRYCFGLLQDGRITVPELYEEILAPSLNRIVVCRASERDMIWREHVMTGIVRGVIESVYPYVLAERDRRGIVPACGKALLACPEEEYHDMGIRMGADFFAIAGYRVTFVGANTPKANILSAAREIKPDVVDLSVSNYLNLVALEKIVPEVRGAIGEGARVYVSGSALPRTGKTAADFGADGIVNSFRDVMNLGVGA